MPDKKQVIIYTDGSCLSNPGPGGWAAVILADGKEKELSGGAPDTTNNRMELMAVISALTALNGPCKVTLYSDSQYVINAFEKGWLNGWKKNGWKNSADNLKNVDLWKLLDKIVKLHDVTWVWVKGHAGNKYNEICDRLAVSAAKHYQANGDTPYKLPEDENDDLPVEGAEPANAAQEGLDQQAMGESSPEMVAEPSEEQIMPPFIEGPTDEPEIPFSLDEEDGATMPSLPIEDANMALLCREDNETDPVVEELLVEGVQDVLPSVKALEHFIAHYNQEIAGVKYPCGAFDWCEHCIGQAPEDGICKCAQAYMKFLESEEDKE